jgi:nucleotide-binding universal stress UspA family protein
MNIRRILLPTDFSEYSRAAERSACELVDRFGAELHVLHVLHDLMLTMPLTAAALLIPPKSLDNEITFAEEEIQKVPPPRWANGKKIVRAVRIGTVYDTIVQYAKDNAIDLIVIGTHGRTGLSHVLLCSVAERVVQHATCSVMTVRPEQKVAVPSATPQRAALETV